MIARVCIHDYEYKKECHTVAYGMNDLTANENKSDHANPR